MQQLQAGHARVYLLLSSLKDVLTYKLKDLSVSLEIQSFIQPIWSQLQHHCANPEEGTRTVVSECMGKLALISPQHMAATVLPALSSPDHLARATAVGSLKFAFFDSTQALPTEITASLPRFLAALKDEWWRSGELRWFLSTVSRTPARSFFSHLFSM
eukprot:m.907550 g.907550  ORF g.907550 m.907550 type:complete len:158 (+) comp60092_c0_seq6:2901-3374(+)